MFLIPANLHVSYVIPLFLIAISLLANASSPTCTKTTAHVESIIAGTSMLQATFNLNVTAAAIPVVSHYLPSTTSPAPQARQAVMGSMHQSPFILNATGAANPVDARTTNVLPVATSPPPQSLRPQSMQSVIDKELPFAETNRSYIESPDTQQKIIIDELLPNETNRSAIDSLDGTWWRIGTVRSWMNHDLEDKSFTEREDLSKPSSKQLAVHGEHEHSKSKKVNKNGETKREAAIHAGVNRLVGGILVALMLFCLMVVYLLVKIMGWT